MNSQINMCDTKTSTRDIIYAFLSLVVCAIGYMKMRKDAENLHKQLAEQRNKKNDKNAVDDNKTWDIWFESDKYKEKDVNKWYIIPGDTVVRYKGEWKNGLPNGKGIREILGSTNNDHFVLEGNFVDGKLNGYGKQTFDITIEAELIAPYYEGEFKNSFPDGFGTYYYGDGCYRKGTSVEGKYVGKGLFYNNKKHRTWVGIYKDDERETGIWVNGELTFEDTLQIEISDK